MWRRVKTDVIFKLWIKILIFLCLFFLFFMLNVHLKVHLFLFSGFFCILLPEQQFQENI